MEGGSVGCAQKDPACAFEALWPKKPGKILKTKVFKLNFEFSSGKRLVYTLQIRVTET